MIVGEHRRRSVLGAIRDGQVHEKVAWLGLSPFGDTPARSFSEPVYRSKFVPRSRHSTGSAVPEEAESAKFF